MTQIKARFIQHPYAFEANWISRNPVLKNGEEGYAIVTVNGLQHVRKKVGPGAWNDLEYFDGVVWTDTNPVTSPINDASGNLAGLTPIEILDLMLNQYQAPVVSGGLNNANGGSFVNKQNIEIGLNVTDPVTVKYAVTNQGNLSGTNPITVTAGGRFNNEGNFPVGDVVLSHSGFNPTNLDLITISIQASHLQGTSNTTTTSLEFNPKIISAVGPVQPADGAAIMALANKQFVVSRDYTRDYTAGSAGHSILCIPSMLTPTNVVFTDVTDPNLPAGYAMDDLGVMSINNGVGTYDYQVYASTFYLLNSTIYRVA